MSESETHRIMKIVIDGNDGTGKSTIVNELRKRGIKAVDRGIPTYMTDRADVIPKKDEFYVILDVTVAMSRKRLKDAGKNLNERYHTVKDLTHYRKRFLDIFPSLPCAVLIDSSGSLEETLEKCLEAIKENL